MESVFLHLSFSQWRLCAAAIQVDTCSPSCWMSSPPFSVSRESADNMMKPEWQWPLQRRSTGGQSLRWWVWCGFHSALATLTGYTAPLTHFTFKLWSAWKVNTCSMSQLWCGQLVSDTAAALQDPGLDTGLHHRYVTAALTDGYASSLGSAHATFIQAVPALLPLPHITLYIFPCLPGSSSPFLNRT